MNQAMVQLTSLEELAVVVGQETLVVTNSYQELACSNSLVTKHKVDSIEVSNLFSFNSINKQQFVSQVITFVVILSNSL